MSVPFFDITRQNSELKKALSEAVSEAINSGRYILGPNVTEFEKEFAAYCGTKYSVGVASGTDALHLALKAIGVGPDNEVITSPFTFVATIEAIVYCGAKPVFIDIEPDSFNLDSTKLEAKITPKTKAILPVHLFGLTANMTEICSIAKKHNLAIVEDCAQAAGAMLKEQKVGSFGLGAFSFFPTKNLGCFGDGGAITTDDENVVTELKALRNHGCHKTYHHEEVGFNSRLDEIQAVVLRIKLKILDNLLYARRENTKQYIEQLSEIKEIILPTASSLNQHTYNQFTLRVKDRDKLQKFLKEKGIPAMVYYPISLHLQEAYQALGGKIGDFPVSEQAQKEVLSLPIFPELQDKEINQVCQAIRGFYKG